jgi:hypothetical protein
MAPTPRPPPPPEILNPTNQARDGPKKQRFASKKIRIIEAEVPSRIKINAQSSACLSKKTKVGATLVVHVPIQHRQLNTLIYTISESTAT